MPGTQCSLVRKLVRMSSDHQARIVSNRGYSHLEVSGGAVSVLTMLSAIALHSPSSELSVPAIDWVIGQTMLYTSSCRKQGCTLHNYVCRVLHWKSSLGATTFKLAVCTADTNYFVWSMAE